MSGIDSLEHYLKIGINLERQASKIFSPAKYLIDNPDVANAGVNPINHLISHGYKEGRLNSYSNWIIAHEYLLKLTDIQIKLIFENLKIKPRISLIMPTYNPNKDYIIKAVYSIINQEYKNWELCICDDASTDKETLKILKYLEQTDNRIKIVYRNENGHIAKASNDAIKVASGDYIAFIDQDDLLADQALIHLVKYINEYPDAKMFYSDEDKIEGEERKDPYFKPDFDIYLLRAQNMVTHLAVYKKDVLEKVGYLSNGVDGSQDWDLVLKVADEVSKRQIVHIPRVLYHWRIHDQSTASSSSNAKPYTIISAEKALNNHFERNNINATIDLVNETKMFRIKYLCSSNRPKVDIIICSKNSLDLIESCISSIIQKTKYDNYQITICDNGSEDPDVMQYYKKLQSDKRIKIISFPGDFNYSAINNFGVANSNSEYVLFLNNDTQVINEEWLSEMVSLASQSDVGVVGARLLYPNNCVQHAGVILGLGGVAAHAHRSIKACDYGYYVRSKITHAFSAVTGACMLVKRSLFLEVCGFDEVHLKIAYNDIDFCLKIKKMGLTNIYCAEALLYHYESASRGEDLSPEKKLRLDREANVLVNRWHNIIQNDPSYNPNLSLDSEIFEYAWPPRIEY